MGNDGVCYQSDFQSEASLRRFAESFGGCLHGGEIIALAGPVGAGKTVFTQNLALGLGVSPDIRVISPTFVLHRRYTGRVMLDHMDVYRLSSALEFEALGVMEIFENDGVAVVEWADKVMRVFPEQTFWIQLSITGLSERFLTVQYPPERFLSTATLNALKSLKFFVSSKG